MLNYTELAERLNIALPTLYAWRKQGMPYVTKGKKKFYQYEDVSEWLKEKEKHAKFKNEYVSKGETTIIYAISKGEKVEIIIDTDKIDWIKSNVNSMYISEKKYVYCSVGKKELLKKKLLHRLLMELDDRNLEVDHINRNPLDNRLKNLRICTGSENCKNKNLVKSNTISGFTNITKNTNTGKWVVQFKINGKVTNFGTFEDLEEAKKRVLEFREKHGYSYK